MFNRPKFVLCSFTSTNQKFSITFKLKASRTKSLSSFSVIDVAATLFHDSFKGRNATVPASAKSILASNIFFTTYHHRVNVHHCMSCIPAAFSLMYKLKILPVNFSEAEI